MKPRAWNSTLPASTKPMKRGPGPKRRTPMAPINRKRRARLQAAAFGPQADLCRNGPCDGCGRPGPCDPHHTTSRASGGTDADTCALCRMCHVELHTVGRATFEARHGVDLTARARERALYAAHHEEE